MKKKIISLLLFITTFFCIDWAVSLVLNKGIDNYFGLNQHSQVLLIGHSHLMLATDKERLENGIHKKVSKYCREGVNVSDRYVMIKQYLESPFSDSLQYVFYGVDQFMFTGAGLSKNSYKLFYPFMDADVMNQYIRDHAEDKYDYWSHKAIRSTRYSDALINSAIRGWRNDWSNYKSGELNLKLLQKEIVAGKQRKIEFEKELITVFEETLHLLTQRNIRVILVNTPIAQPLNEYEPNKYRQIITYFEDKTSHPLIEYWDYNTEYADQYQLFFDPIHLNPIGQKTITDQIIRSFNTTQ